MYRNLNVQIGAWPSVPPSVVAALGVGATSIAAVLLRTALSTRPPVIQGFQLADFWAWMRYAPALDRGPGLRLRPEWATVDAHQKTVLSDELGVGFTTEFLARTLAVREFVDAAYVLNVLQRGAFKVLRTGKRGPGKTPDYIGRIGPGQYCVLECKGSQSKASALHAAMERGIEQKENLQSGASARIVHSLVGGLFIPQHASSESAQLWFIDPDPDEFALALDQVPIETIDAAILAVETAKEMTFFGHGDLAAALMSAPSAGPSGWDEVKRRLGSGSNSEARTISERSLPGPEESVLHIAFRGQLNDRLLATVSDSRSSGEAMASIRDRFGLERSSYEDHATVSRVVTSVGCMFEVEIEGDAG